MHIMHMRFGMSVHWPAWVQEDSQSAQDQQSSATRYAILHDFCMLIPYSALVASTGVYFLIRGPLALGILTMIAALSLYQCARTSLSRWRVGLSNAPPAWLAAILSLYIAYMWGAPPGYGWTDQ